ncbi:hypothetical protein ACIG47_19740 [Promicromonospora sp. NPDC052451]|uniref:hypothetical protein n=1 Tax=Promicromonospora sp. NPDC052451 TaxID=3364407 RepID=UPI0037CADB4F
MGPAGPLEVLDGWWDPRASLLADPTWAAGPRDHHVRETCWYALGLLSRAADGGATADVDRAVAALGAVLDQQWDDPAVPWHGTWRRSPAEPDPSPEHAREWRDYDPNWREFIGCTLLQVVAAHAGVLPPALLSRIDAALVLAATGTSARRVDAGYSNIALMAAFLLHAVGRRTGNAAWDQQGLHLAGEVFDRFEEHGTFEEYNSPTYYGIDLYGLALWRRHGLDPATTARAAAVELALWDEIARHYHAGLANMVGPYDRSYGMDLQEYASGVGVWIWSVVGRERAPFPDHTGPIGHHRDLALVPLVAALGAPDLPARTRAALETFDGPRATRQVITARRVATTVLQPHLMVGAEDVGGDRGRLDGQFHPLTAHWRPEEPGPVGWFRLVSDLTIDAAAHPTAEPDSATATLRWTGAGTVRFQVRPGGSAGPEPSAPEPSGATTAAIDLTARSWRLPSLLVRVTTSARLREVTRSHDGTWWVAYDTDGPGEARLDLARRPST